MNFLVASSVPCLCLGLRRALGLCALRPGFRRGRLRLRWLRAAARRPRLFTGRSRRNDQLHRALGDTHGQVRGPLHDAENARPIGGANPLLRLAAWFASALTNSRSTSPPNPSLFCAFAIASATPSRCRARCPCARTAASRARGRRRDQVEHQPRLLRGGAHVFRGGVRLNRHYAPPLGAPAAPGGAAAATAAALSAFVVCPS